MRGTVEVRFRKTDKGDKMRLNVKALSLTAGILWGIGVWFATLWLVVFGYEGFLMSKLDHFYFGYTVTVGGAFVGLAWGFVDGVICGALFAWLYNTIAKV
jgi:hypothetical protein